ncbi:hypothetical protein A2U01_0029435, partial [Trifolium medium]|nr:hypothetical protein [Trifolium medium]
MDSFDGSAARVLETRTLFEIASTIGMPLALDETTKNRTFGQYARILVDLEFSQRIFDEILVEREGYAFKLSVVYEQLPEFCHHCHVIGHNVLICKWLHPPKKHPAVTEKDDNLKVVTAGKQPASEVPEVDIEQPTTDDIVTSTPNSSVAGRQKEVPAKDEVQNLVSHETHADLVQQLSVENN